MMQAAQEQQQLLARFMVDGAVVDQRYWFAKSYYLVTLRLLADAADSKYYYPSFVLLSMLYFKKAYVDNLDRWDLDRQCEWQWQVAFGYSEAEIGEFFNSKVPALSPSPPDRWVGGAIAALINVMRSAEAHLRFDLSRCVAWIYLTHYPSDIVHLSAFRDDFFNMAALFDAVTADMQAEIDAYTGAIFTGLPAEVAGLNLIDIAAEYGNGRTIDAEREATWARAQDLVDAFGIRLFSPYSLAYGPADSTFQYLQLSGDVTRGDYLECFDEIQNPPDMEASALLEPVLDYITGI
jgi:hypothetical protein